MFRPRTVRVAIYRAIPVVLCGIPSFAQFVPNRYTVLLEDPPVATRSPRREDMQTAAAVGYRNRIEAPQQQVRRELASRNSGFKLGSDRSERHLL